jgi:spermidine/putrescine-binding protein
MVLAACGSDDTSDSTTDTTADTTATSDAASSTEAPAATEAPGDGGDAGAAMTELGEGEGEVNLIAWAGYVEDGSTDPAVDWVTPFEEATGCQVNPASFERSMRRKSSPGWRLQSQAENRR